MNIEPNTSISATTAGRSHAKAELSPELEHLLAQLKLRIGDKIDAVINKITVLSDSDHKFLQEMKPQAGTPADKQAWQTLLSQPTLKLVELRHQQSLFSAVTDLPVYKGQQLTVVISNKGLQLLNLIPEGSNAAAGSRASLLASSVTADSVPRISSESSLLQTARSQPDPGAQGKPGTVAIGPPPLLARPGSTSAVGGYSAPPDGSRVTTGSSSPPVNPAQSNNVAPTHLLSPNLSSTRPTATAVQALAEAVATALPKAQPTSLMLPSSMRLAALLQHLPEQSLPAVLKPLLPLLNKLQQQVLEIPSTTPLPATTIAKAINNNGVFHEHNALLAIARKENPPIAPTADDDIKSLLIKTLESLGQPPPNQTAATAKPTLAGDAVARLWLGLVNGLGSKVETQKLDVSKKENLLHLAQSFAQNSLAKIQLNQYRSLPIAPGESGPANQAIYLDIPIRWPDHYGNAYLQIFPPKVQEEKSESQDKQKRQKQARWRVFMELELGEEGNLAVELTVADELIDAVFWAEKDSLRRKAAEQLQHLRSELTEHGLQVAELRCSSNPPPEQKINLDYAIIDIKT